ncbi:MAG: cobalt-precorrin 5A hydrolase [Bacteroidia bacterium]|nr:MAG: cobalt-precorrin 5A hydrolase [Bacteroidia bacterium]
MTGIISISKQGNILAAQLSELLDSSLCYALEKYNKGNCLPIEGRLKTFCGSLFEKHDALIFIMATGIVVRSIAPWIRHKTKDPAVLVIDDKGTHVISLLSGHLGGANALTLKVAELISAKPVITTSSDVNKRTSVDMLAQKYGLLIDSMSDAKDITAIIVNGGTVALDDDCQIINEPIRQEAGTTIGKIIVSNKAHIAEQLPFVKLIPKNIILGLGCRKGILPSKFMDFINDTLKVHNIDKRSIRLIASIDVKKEERAILEAGKTLNVPCQFYSAESLQEVDDLFEGSAFVKQTVGVASVSTCSAYTAAKKSGIFLAKKIKKEGMTISIVQTSLKT